MRLNSLHKSLSGVDEKFLVMLSDIFLTGFKCSVLNSKVLLGSSVVIVSARLVSLAALVTTQLYLLSIIIIINSDKNRLNVAKSFRATHTVTPKNAINTAKSAALGKGCDTVIEAVRILAMFD